MAQPDVYARAFEFDPLATPVVPDAGVRLDAELDRVAEIFAQYRERLALIQRDDGKIANGAVTPESLSARTRTLIASGWELRGAWLTATAYLAKDVISQGGLLYVCVIPHTAGVFATDLAAGRWLVWYEENVIPGAGSITTSMLSGTITFDATRLRAVAAPGVEKRILVFDDAGVPTVENLTTTLQQLLDEVVPLGTMAYYKGDTSLLPSTWAVCDGTNGTPNLRGLFLIGSNDSTFPPDSTGGSSTINSGAAGDHTHGGATGSTALTIDQIPSHTHTYENVITGSGSPFLSGGTAWGKVTNNTGAAGGGLGHTHTIGASGTHQHTVTILPPYYSAVIIMRVGNFVIPGAATTADGFFGFAASDESTPLTVDTEIVTLRMPFAWVSIDEVRASLTDASSSGVVEIDVKVNGTSLFSTNLTIDANETTSVTAATPFVLDPGNHGPFPDDSEITVDVVAAGTSATGLKVTLIGTRAV
jgi:hypothetical protein